MTLGPWRRTQAAYTLTISALALHLSWNLRWISLHGAHQNRSRLLGEEIEKSFQQQQDVLPTNHTVELTPRPLCNRKQVRDGSWQPVSLEKAPYVSHNKHLRCFPEEVYRQSPYKTWEWTPHDESCEWQRWNATFFCDLVQYASISVIGDSLSWEQYSSLLQLLGERVHQMDQHKSKSEKRNHVQKGCRQHGGAKFVFRNDPRLEQINASIRSDFPIVLVLNRGAHYVNDTVLLRGIRQNVAELRQWGGTCQRMGIRCHLFWRTTVPGHPFCTNFSQPINDLKFMEDHIANLNNYNNVTITYNWYQFKRQNELILQTLEDSGLEFTVLDAYEVNILRPDDHREGECLHNCYPGKMDVYNQMLLHFLSMERSVSDRNRYGELLAAARARSRGRH